MDTLAVIMPAFNAARFVGEALDSIFAQSRPADEIVVVDDGSTDATPQILARYGDRLTVIRQDNAGPGAARNAAIAAVAAQIVVFCDADDVNHPRRFARQTDHLATHPGDAGVFCLQQNFWEDELLDEAERHRDRPIAKPHHLPTTCTLCVRRDAFKSVGAFRTDIWVGEDVEWFQRAEAAGLTFGTVEETLLHRRFHSANLSRRRDQGRRDDLAAMLKARLDTARKK